MCGICGEIRFDGSLPDIESLQVMSEVLVPRGPDAGGLFHANHIAVAHRRLKIIDLSEHAQQPMLDNELGLGIVFNGCIYNYRELRAGLRALGHDFRRGDTIGHANCIEVDPATQGFRAVADVARDGGEAVAF